MRQRFQPGVCKACQLAACEREWFKGFYAAGLKRLANGVLRRAGINRRIWYHHRHGLCKGRAPYWSAAEYARRRESVRQVRRYWWKPGQSGNPRGRPKGAKDRKPRRRPQGIAAAIKAEREERAEKLRRQFLAALEAE